MSISVTHPYIYYNYLWCRNPIFCTSIKYLQASKPMYIRDCLEGLIDHKNQEEMEFCLTNVTHLVEVDVVAAKEVRF